MTQLFWTYFSGWQETSIEVLSRCPSIASKAVKLFLNIFYFLLNLFKNSGNGLGWNSSQWELPLVFVDFKCSYNQVWIECCYVAYVVVDSCCGVNKDVCYVSVSLVRCFVLVQLLFLEVAYTNFFLVWFFEFYTPYFLYAWKWTKVYCLFVTAHLPRR
jgi:hypothetical protein